MSIMAFIWNQVSPGILIYISTWIYFENEFPWMNECLRMHISPVFDTLTKDQNLQAKPDQNPMKNKAKQKTLNKYTHQHLHTQQWCHYDNRLAGPAGISGGRSVRGLYCANINDPGFETLDTDASLCEYVHDYIFMFMCTHVWSSARGWVPTAWI